MIVTLGDPLPYEHMFGHAWRVVWMNRRHASLFRERAAMIIRLRQMPLGTKQRVPEQGALLGRVYSTSLSQRRVPAVCARRRRTSRHTATPRKSNTVSQRLHGRERRFNRGWMHSATEFAHEAVSFDDRQYSACTTRAVTRSLTRPTLTTLASVRSSR